MKRPRYGPKNGAPVDISDAAIDFANVGVNSNPASRNARANHPLAAAAALDEIATALLAGSGTSALSASTGTSSPPPQPISGIDPILARLKQATTFSAARTVGFVATAGGDAAKRPWLTQRSAATTTAVTHGGANVGAQVPNTAVSDAMQLLVEAPIVLSAAERAADFMTSLERDAPPSFWQTAYDPRGIPTVAEWDVPFLKDETSYFVPSVSQVPAEDVAINPSAFHNLLHHPVLPMHPIRADECSLLQEEGGQGIKLIQTKEELRAERRKLAAKKREEEEAKARSAKQQAKSGGVVDAGPLHEDRLTWKNLHDKGRLEQLALDPQGLHDKIEEQYRQRFEQHQLQNYQRHVAALPAQAQKKLDDAWRHAEEKPRLHCYRVPKARNAFCVNRLRNFANDAKLRGFLLWIAEEELVVVLVGGEVAMRHLDRWICEKMEWHRYSSVLRDDVFPPDGAPVSSSSAGEGSRAFDPEAAPKLHKVDPSILERTKGYLCASIPLYRAGDVSVLLPKQTMSSALESRRRTRQQELVFVRQAATITEARQFMCDTMPAGGILESFDFLWRSAYPPLGV